MKNLEKIIGIFFIITAISIISVWILLIMTDQIPEFNNDLIKLSFHWTSEFLLAGMSVLTAALLFKNKLPVKLMIFLNMGLLLCSTFQASAYYLFTQLDWVMFLVVFTFFIAGLYLTFNALKKFYIIGMARGQGRAFNFAFLFFGVLIYHFMNLTGEHFQAGDISYLLTDGFILITTIYIVILGLKKSRFSLNL